MAPSRGHPNRTRPGWHHPRGGRGPDYTRRPEPSQTIEILLRLPAP